MNPTIENYSGRFSNGEAVLKKADLLNGDGTAWQKAAIRYRARPDGGPILKIVEGDVWEIPTLELLARYPSSEEAERVLLAAGFSYIPEAMGFRA